MRILVRLKTWVLLLPLACAPQRPATEPEPEVEMPGYFRTPPNELLFVAQLGLRGQITGESPWVIVCPPVTLDVDRYNKPDNPRERGGMTRSVSVSSDCRLPIAATTDSVDPGLSLVSITRSEYTGIMRLLGSSPIGPLHHWTECYWYYRVSRSMGVSTLPGDDCTWIPTPLPANPSPPSGTSLPRTDSLISQYLVLRQQFHPRTLMVRICDAVGLGEPRALEQRLRDELGVIQSLEGSASCTHPSLTGADTLIEALVIKRVIHTDTTSILDVATARPWPKQYPRSWDEVYIQWNHGAAIEIRGFPAVD